MGAGRLVDRNVIITNSTKDKMLSSKKVFSFKGFLPILVKINICSLYQRSENIQTRILIWHMSKDLLIDIVHERLGQDSVRV